MVLVVSLVFGMIKVNNNIIIWLRKFILTIHYGTQFYPARNIFPLYQFLLWTLVSASNKNCNGLHLYDSWYLLLYMHECLVSIISDAHIQSKPMTIKHEPYMQHNCYGSSFRNCVITGETQWQRCLLLSVTCMSMVSATFMCHQMQPKRA